MDFKDRLINLPEEIKAAQEKLVLLIEDTEGLVEANKKVENTTMDIIMEEKDSEDKPRFSNDFKRKNELSRRLSLDVGYKHVAQLIVEKIKERSKLEIEIDCMKRQFIAAEVLTRRWNE